MAKAKTNKVTDNKVNAKETKTMAKANSKANVTLELTGTVEGLTELKAILEKMGITSETKEACKVITDNAKWTKKVGRPPKTVKKTEEKPFDRERYLEIGKKLNMVKEYEDGKAKVLSPARPVVYKAMEELGTVILTKKALEKYRNELIEIATEKKYENMLKRLGIENTKEVEVEEEVI